MRAPALKLINKRLAAVLLQVEDYAGEVCDDQILSALCSILYQACAAKSAAYTSARRSALVKSLEHMKEKNIDGEVLKANMHRIIANWHFIYEGMVIPEWDGTRINADIVFIGVLSEGITAGGRAKYLAEVKLKSGLGAGIILCVSLYDAAIYRFLERYSGTRSFDCPAEEISGMEARVSISIQSAQARIHEWDCTTAQREHNKDLAEHRIDINKCRLQKPCNVCKKTILECPLAVWLPNNKKE